MQKRIYVIVQIDIDFDDKVINERDVVDEAVSQFDYNFKLNKSTGMTVTDTEICGVSPESYD